MAERQCKEVDGVEYERQVKPVWAIITVQGILDNDFYIGTLRQNKYTRKKIDGKELKRDETNHQAIIDYRTFATTKALREKRTISCYQRQHLLWFSRLRQSHVRHEPQRFEARLHLRQLPPQGAKGLYQPPYAGGFAGRFA